MSHVDAIAVLLEYLKPIALSVQQAPRVSRGRRFEPIQKIRVPALNYLSVKMRGVSGATSNSLIIAYTQAEDRAKLLMALTPVSP
jgi:hypothetical protein